MFNGVIYVNCKYFKVLRGVGILKFLYSFFFMSNPRLSRPNTKHHLTRIACVKNQIVMNVGNN